MALVFLGPRRVPGLPAWPQPVARIAAVAGLILMVAGGALFLAGLFRLGTNLTPLPRPKATARWYGAGSPSPGPPSCCFPFVY